MGANIFKHLPQFLSTKTLPQAQKPTHTHNHTHTHTHTDTHTHTHSTYGEIIGTSIGIRQLPLRSKWKKQAYLDMTKERKLEKKKRMERNNKRKKERVN